MGGQLQTWAPCDISITTAWMHPVMYPSFCDWAYFSKLSGGMYELKQEARTGTACTKPFTDGQTYQAVERYFRLLIPLRCVRQRPRQTYSRAFKRPFTIGLLIHIGSQHNYLPVSSGWNFPKRIFCPATLVSASAQFVLSKWLPLLHM